MHRRELIFLLPLYAAFLILCGDTLPRKNEKE